MPTPTATRRYAKRLPPEERREQILDAALRLIAREGWAALRVERVAAQADIAKSVVYAQFGSPDGLTKALLTREFARAEATAEAAVAAAIAAPTVVSAIETALLTFLERAAAEPDTWRLAALPADGAPPRLRRTARASRDRWWHELEPVIARTLDAAGLRGVDPELAAHVLRGNAEYLVRLMLDDPKRYPRERLAAFVSDLARRGPWVRP